MSNKKILLVNKFYYSRGGDCLVMMNTEHLLQAAGYEVAVYAMSYEQNIASPYSSLFASEVKFSGKGIIKAAMRSLGMGDIVQSFSNILQEFRPDIVHFHNIHSYLSPIIVKQAYNFGCKVLWTMHDYKVLCPSYSCLRNGKPCQLCFNDKSQVLRHRCMKNSLPASILAYIEALRWNKSTLQKYVHHFIAPSQFMRSKMVEAGYDADRISVICNCIDKNKSNLLAQATYQKPDTPYYCYVGRLSQEKGIEQLLVTAAQLPYKLYVAGTGPLADTLQKQYANNDNIVFTGHLTANQVVELVTNAEAMVIPSAWYENNPLSVIESLCMGTPVIGARIGGIPELIDEHETGLLYDNDNSQELQSHIKSIFEQNHFNRSEIANKSRMRFSEENHLSQLIALF